MVHFVGAGCGAADLITVRGMRLLQTADIIIYAGSLVNPELLQYADDKCVIHDSAYLNLEETISIIKDAEAKNLNIVRLHTGDPSLYGAIKEQMAELDKLGIEYDLCPGVSAYQGAAASLKLEYTLPGKSQTLIITRAEGRTPVPKKEQLNRLAGSQSTMVLYLSSGLAAKVKTELIQGGYSGDTPVAVVYKASWPEEQIIRCTLNSLPEAMVEANIDRTAVIIVGEVIEGDFEYSKLYDPEFSTMYRKGRE